MGNQTLGKGKVLFSLLNEDGSPVGFRYIGNTPSFGITIANETLDHFSSDEGIRQKDKSIVLETTATGTLVCDDISLPNLAMAFFGEYNTLAQTSSTGLTETIADVKQGLLYQIGTSDANPTGVRSISNVAVEVATVAKTVDVDYTVDATLGTITIVDGGTIADGDDIDITYDRAAVSRDQVLTGDEQVEGAIMFVSYNPEGEKRDYLMPLVRLSPNGEFGLKSDEWQQLSMNVEILKATSRERIYVDGRPYTP